MNGVFAQDVVSIGPVNVNQFTFIYANSISMKNSSSNWLPGADGIAGMSPRYSSFGILLIQEVIKNFIMKILDSKHISKTKTVD